MPSLQNICAIYDTTDGSFWGKLDIHFKGLTIELTLDCLREAALLFEIRQKEGDKWIFIRDQSLGGRGELVWVVGLVYPGS